MSMAFAGASAVPYQNYPGIVRSYCAACRFPRRAPCNNAQAIERIAALTVGLWGPPEGMVFHARAASRLEFPTVLR
jgi:hypothetical protein